MTWEGFTDEDLQVFEKVARALRRKAFGVMTEEDLYQSCALWALEHKGKYRAAADEGESHAHRLLWTRMVDLIRREKARVGGYETEDQYGYSPKALKKLLPCAFDPEWMVQAQDYDTIRTTGGSGHSDPADVWVMVADVKAGYLKLPKKDQVLLFRTLVAAPDYSVACQQIAAEEGLTPSQVQVKVNNGLVKLGRKLRD